MNISSLFLLSLLLPAMITSHRSLKGSESNSSKSNISKTSKSKGPKPNTCINADYANDDNFVKITSSQETTAVQSSENLFLYGSGETPNACLVNVAGQSISVFVLEFPHTSMNYPLGATNLEKVNARRQVQDYIFTFGEN